MIHPVCQLFPDVAQLGVPAGELSAKFVLVEEHIVTQPFLLIASIRVRAMSEENSVVIVLTSLRTKNSLRLGSPTEIMTANMAIVIKSSIKVTPATNRLFDLQGVCPKRAGKGVFSIQVL